MSLLTRARQIPRYPLSSQSPVAKQLGNQCIVARQPGKHCIIAKQPGNHCMGNTSSLLQCLNNACSLHSVHIQDPPKIPKSFLISVKLNLFFEFGGVYVLNRTLTKKIPSNYGKFEFSNPIPSGIHVKRACQSCQMDWDPGSLNDSHCCSMILASDKVASDLGLVGGFPHVLLFSPA